MYNERFFILTEAGGSYGYGHISRCGAIGDELLRRGAKVSYVVNGEWKNAASPVRLMDWANNRDLDFLDGCYCIIDSYLASEDMVAAICRRAKKCLCIDDNNIRSYSNCIVLNPALHAESLNYNASETTEYLLGHQYVILREAFRRKISKRIRPEIKEITITLGGTDVLGLTPVIAKALRDTNIIKNIVIGRNAVYSDFEDFEDFNMGNASLHYDLNAEEMRELFCRSDLVISGGGQTIYELVQCRTPIIIICAADNQRKNISAAIEHGFGKEVKPEEAGVIINTVINEMDYDTRLNIAAHMEKFDFSHGVENIINGFLKGISSKLSI